MRPKLILLALIAAAVPMQVAAQDSEGRMLAERAFESIDQAERGFIDLGEFSNFGKDVFVSMDADTSEKLTLDEFLSWGYGMQLVAEDAGKTDEFETAMRVVFSFWDRNGDNQISKTEHRQSLVFDFQRADVDNDALLSNDEFLSGFSIMVAQRAAINPPAAE